MDKAKTKKNKNIKDKEKLLNTNNKSAKKLSETKFNNLDKNELQTEITKVNNDKVDDIKESANEQVKTATAKKPLTKKQEIINMIKFLLFSISAGVIQILSFTLLSELIFHDAENQYGISYFISLVLSVIWNFTFNKKFTFKSAKNVPLAMLLVFVYYCAFTPLSIWWGIALTDNAGWNSYLVLAMTMIINFLTEYLWTRFIVYKDNINTAPKKEKKLKNKQDINR